MSRVASAEYRAWLARALFHGLVLAGLVFSAYLLLVAAPTKGTFAIDTLCYWGVNLADPYRTPWGSCAVPVPPFGYAPPIALLLAPFTALPWTVFVAGWYALLIAALAWLGRRDVLILAAFPPVALNFADGNIHLLLAVAVVIGFRHPAVWSFVLLAKITCGIGLLWFVARREWRALGLALGATAAIAVITAVLLPSQWLSWLEFLRDSAGTQLPWPALPVPLWLRLPVAAAIVWWGARRDARWTVPIAATLALPALWLGGLAMLAGCWPLRSRAATASAGGADYHAPNGRQPTAVDARPAAA
jgi:Protein of unknown function (DUF2029).